MALRLSVSLFRREAKAFGQLLRSLPKGSPEPQQLQLKQDIGVPCEAWIVAAREKPPSWAKPAHALIETSKLLNVSNSLVLLIEVEARFFAVSFGYGHAFLNQDLLEPEFGLRTTANGADPDKLGAIQVRTLSENSRQQRSQTTNRTGVADFNLEVEREMVRYLKGSVAGQGAPVSSVGGSQMLSLTTKSALTELPAVLTWLLETFVSDAYKTTFPYLDNFLPIRKGDPILKPLGEALSGAIATPGTQRLGVASPDDIFGEEVDHYKITGDGRRRDGFDELTLDEVLAQIADTRKIDPLEQLRITPFAAGGDPIRTARKLRDYFIYETTVGGATYVFCLGHWYRVDGDYVKQINDQVGMIEDVGAKLNLPKWCTGDEGEYNKMVAAGRNWLLLDKQNFRIKGTTHQKVEIADLITEAGDFVCVKRMESSATLSHLFSQAAVSADMYQLNAQGYRQHVCTLVAAHFPGLKLPDKPTMVMAIATDKPGPLADSLFFFSKVNLVQRQRDIARAGFTPALARIERPTRTSGQGSELR